MTCHDYASNNSTTSRPWQTMADHGRPVQRGSRVPWGDLSLRCSTALLIYWGHSCHRTLLSSFWVIKIWPVPEQRLQLGIHRVNGQPKLLLQTGAVQEYFNRVSQSRSKSLRTPTYQETSRNKSKNVKDNMASRLSHQCGSCLQPGCLLDRGWQRLEVGSAKPVLSYCRTMPGPPSGRGATRPVEWCPKHRYDSTTVGIGCRNPFLEFPLIKNTPQELWLRITRSVVGVFQCISYLRD